MHYNYRQKNESARRKLKKILSSPERVAQEEQFAKDHANDTDFQLRQYVKEQKLHTQNFKPYHLIGYNYIVQRFGSWEKIMTVVNRDIELEKNKGKAR